MEENRETRQVTVVVRIDARREVVLTGDFTGWARDRVRLVEDSPGQWRATLELPPGQHQYRLLVDGEWSILPGARRTVPNSMGGVNGIFTVE
jgi:hypothetical protein